MLIYVTRAKLMYEWPTLSYHVTRTNQKDGMHVTGGAMANISHQLSIEFRLSI